MLDRDKLLKGAIIFVPILIVLIILIVYISDRSYINDVVFELNGNKYIELYRNEPWADSGANAFKNGKNLKDYIEIENNFNNSVSGTYKVTYVLKKGLAKRKIYRTIIVRDIDFNSLSFNLIGSDNVYLLQNKPYKELGVTAIDASEGDISKKVVVVGEVNNKKDGVYTLTYLVTNKFNLTKKLTRTITVYSLKYSFNTDFTDDEGYIKFQCNDSDYDYLIDPYRKVVNSQNYNFTVTKNGEYVFKIYDQKGNVIEEKITIDKIDKEAPSGTCVGYMYDNYTDLQVNATDDTGVTGYLYQYGSYKSSKTTKSTYRYTQLINEASVIVYDKEDNATTIKCQMKDNSTVVPAGYRSFSFKNPDGWRVMKYWLYIPKNLHVRTKIPMMVYLHGDGSKTDNVNDVNKYAFPYFVNYDNYEYPFIMLAPQCDAENNWTGETTYTLLIKLIENLKTKYNIDEDRIILSGGSSGGRGAYVIAAMNKNYFSAVVTGSATCDKKYAAHLTNIPIWAFNGTADAAVDYSGAKAFIDLINANGGNAILSTVQGGTHGITETVFRDPNLIKWMIQQKRK